MTTTATNRYQWVIANAAAHLPVDQPQMLAEELKLAKEAAGLLPLQISRLQQYATGTAAAVAQHQKR